MILVAYIFEHASKIVYSDNNYLLLQFSRQTYETNVKKYMYIYLSTYEVTTIFQKDFNCDFLIIKTYLKKRKT